MLTVQVTIPATVIEEECTDLGIVEHVAANGIRGRNNLKGHGRTDAETRHPERLERRTLIKYSSRWEGEAVVGLNASADTFARAFVERPLTLVDTLREFWQCVKTRFEGSQTNRWEFFTDDPGQAEDSFEQLGRIIDGWNAASTRSPALREIKDQYIDRVSIFRSVLSELACDLRATTGQDFDELIGLLEFSLIQHVPPAAVSENKVVGSASPDSLLGEEPAPPSAWKQQRKDHGTRVFEQLGTLYTDDEQYKGMTAAKLAEILGCDPTAIRRLKLYKEVTADAEHRRRTGRI